MSDGVKVVHVINRRVIRGGAEKQLAEIARRSALRHEIVELDAQRAGLELVRGLRRELRARRPSVVVAWLERPQIVASLARPRGTPAIACIRGIPRHRSLPGRWSFRLALSRYSRLVTNSDASRRAIEAFVRPLRVPHTVVIPNGVEPGGGPPTAHARTSGGLRIGYVGRGTFDRDKGLDVLLAALRHETLSDASAVLVGRGVEESLAAANGLAARCEAIEEVEDPWLALADVDVLVVPSRTEGSPNVVLEAFVREIPVVGTASGGTVELLADGRGVTVPSEDPEALAKAVMSIASDPATGRARARRARTYALARHSWDAVVAAYDAQLLDVAGSRADAAGVHG